MLLLGSTPGPDCRLEHPSKCKRLGHSRTPSHSSMLEINTMDTPMPCILSNKVSPFNRSHTNSFPKFDQNNKFHSLAEPAYAITCKPGHLPGTNNNFLTQIWPHRDVLATHLFNKGTLLTIEDLNAKLTPNHISHWTYIQMKHFLSRKETA